MENERYEFQAPFFEHKTQLVLHGQDQTQLLFPEVAWLRQEGEGCSAKILIYHNVQIEIQLSEALDAICKLQEVQAQSK